MPDIEVIEVLVPGQPGAKGAPGAKGDKGDKGDTGDVTPALLDAVEVASNAAIAAEGSAEVAEAASALAAASGSISRETWTALAAMAPAMVGQRATVATSDVGTHTGRTATSPTVDVSGVANAGVYGAYGTGVGQWRWDGVISATGAATVPDVKAGSGTTTFVTPQADKAALDDRLGPSGSWMANGLSIVGWARAWTDAYGRVAAGIKSTGQFYAQSLVAKIASITSLTVTTIALAGRTEQESAPDAHFLQAVVDQKFRRAAALRPDGTIAIAKLEDGDGRLVYPRIQAISDVADAALLAGQTGGASATRQAMMQGRTLHGGLYRPSMDTPPTITLVQSIASIPGFTLSPWNATGKWRTLGGMTSQLGGNSFLRWLTFSPTGNINGFTGCLGAAVEFDHAGTEFYFYIRGNGQKFRIIVDGQFATPNYLSVAPDGAGYQCHVDFAGISDTRRIRIEGGGSFQWGGVWVKSGESISAPAEAAPPKLCFLGTSISEGANSSNPWSGQVYRVARLLGADPWNTGVGGAGILNPGQEGSGRVKQRDRSQDYTANSFVCAIDENGINDTSYVDASIGLSDATRYQMFLDEYRRNLDLWFTAHPDTPWIAWGPYWPNDTPNAAAYQVRDAKAQACGEYKNAVFIDTLALGPMIPKVMAQTGSFVYMDGTDVTHPIERGYAHVGDLLFPLVDQVIRTRI